jgi:carboxynorspermidine decarboxylase
MANSILDLKHTIPTSPAFILDEDQLIANLDSLMHLRQAGACKVLYAMKALPLARVLAVLKPYLDGISVSSLFEARLCREIWHDQGSIHLSTPGLRRHEFAELAGLCSHISFNSLPQFDNLHALASGYSQGLRVNPKLSFVSDERFDPCRPNSKLGIDIKLVAEKLPDGIAGLHFHNIFASLSIQPLLQCIEHILPLLKQYKQLKWLNLGGGYLFQEITDLSALMDLLNYLKSEFSIEVFVEPGKAIVGNAAYLMTTVLDKFDSDGKTVLVLDTTVNHHPEVFEYQVSPALMEADTADRSAAVAILAGSSCLAGDLFGEYRFTSLPEVGDRLVFQNIGAYSLIKANRFNGYNLPDIYCIQQGEINLYKQFDYAEFQRQWR